MNIDHDAADIHGVPDSERLSRAGEIAGGKAVAGKHAGSAAARPSAASAGYGWAIISESDGTARLQVRDENGGAVNVDLLKAARILQSLGAGE